MFLQGRTKRSKRRFFLMGKRYKTGEDAPRSGVYTFVEHVGRDLDCQPTPEENEIVLERGETFPPHRSCEEAAWWEFGRRT